ncbi:hypothetical protein AGR7A_Cc210096 [Agrobacterium deltaense NCPPB 1641]|uniref:Uncharacterized protein n=1 Tax=Agrobacterium deltaense NCPPB 1641 TaxID=1183425 RepID=A0A1S7TLU3_9HYPH|nr:hypothetical protein AGR7A_Cc210096 [Agrobacterium deltaense NCPPB 1641]
MTGLSDRAAPAGPLSLAATIFLLWQATTAKIAHHTQI